jgi:hypothetical protein
MKIPAPNRLAVYATIAAGILTAVAPLVADLDTTSTATLIAGLAAIVVAVVKWLTGWQNLEKAEAQNTVLALQAEREAAHLAEARAGSNPRSTARKLDFPR